MSFTLTTPRLILRDFRESDWIAVHSYASNPKVVEHMNWGPNTEADTQAFVKKAMHLALAKPRLTYHVAVVNRDTDQVIGGATLRMVPGDPHSGELGYTLHPQAWGQGFATELAKAFIQYGFMELQLQRIWATCRPENIGSFRILMKTGMRFQEYLQNERLVRGHLVDSLLCTLSREDWLRASALSATSSTEGQ